MPPLLTTGRWTLSGLRPRSLSSYTPWANLFNPKSFIYFLWSKKYLKLRLSFEIQTHTSNCVHRFPILGLYETEFIIFTFPLPLTSFASRFLSKKMTSPFALRLKLEIQELFLTHPSNFIHHYTICNQSLSSLPWIWPPLSSLTTATLVWSTQTVEWRFLTHLLASMPTNFSLFSTPHPAWFFDSMNLTMSSLCLNPLLTSHCFWWHCPSSSWPPGPQEFLPPPHPCQRPPHSAGNTLFLPRMRSSI